MNLIFVYYLCSFKYYLFATYVKHCNFSPYCTVKSASPTLAKNIETVHLRRNFEIFEVL